MTDRIEEILGILSKSKKHRLFAERLLLNWVQNADFDDISEFLHIHGIKLTPSMWECIFRRNDFNEDDLESLFMDMEDDLTISPVARNKLKMYFGERLSNFQYIEPALRERSDIAWAVLENRHTQRKTANKLIELCKQDYREKKLSRSLILLVIWYGARFGEPITKILLENPEIAYDVFKYPPQFFLNKLNASSVKKLWEKYKKSLQSSIHLYKHADATMLEEAWKKLNSRRKITTNRNGSPVLEYFLHPRITLDIAKEAWEILKIQKERPLYIFLNRILRISNKHPIVTTVANDLLYILADPHMINENKKFFIRILGEDKTMAHLSAAKLSQ